MKLPVLSMINRITHKSPRHAPHGPARVAWLLAPLLLLAGCATTSGGGAEGTEVGLDVDEGQYRRPESDQERGQDQLHGWPVGSGASASLDRAALGTGMPSRIIQTRDTDFIVNRPIAITSPSHIPQA